MKYNIFVVYEDYFNSYSIENKKINDMVDFDFSLNVIKTIEEIHTNSIQQVYNTLMKYFSFGIVYDYIYKNFGEAVANSIRQ
jgi:hypothetical protein